VDAERERDLIRSVCDALTQQYGVVVDDVVLRSWENAQLELDHLLLGSALRASGAVVIDDELWPFARAVAFATPVVERARETG
jgi:hypothetical protein